MTPEVHQRNPGILHVFRLRKDREQHVPDSPNHPLSLTKLFNSTSPEGHCGGNQPLDGSICLYDWLLLSPCPNRGFKDFLSKASRAHRKIRTLWSHLFKVAVSLASVFEQGWPHAWLSMMSPSSGRAASLAAILALSARSSSAVWALAAASVTWACCWINTAYCCCIAICLS